MRERLRQVLEQYAKSPNWTPRQEARSPLFWKSIRAEFLGAFLLVIFSCSGDTYIGPVSYGCLTCVLTYTLRATGVHLNPMVTLAAVFLRSITPFRFVSFILAQSIGTLSGATVVSLGLSGNESHGTANPTLLVSQAKGFGYEFFATFVIILATASHLDATSSSPASSPSSSSSEESMFPLISGIAVGTASAFSRAATGGFLNPVRAFSLALFQETIWSTHYVYWVGPILGTLLAVFTYDFIRIRPPSSLPKYSTGNGHLSVVAKHEDEITQQDTEFTLATLS
ncbi:putative Aquaporin-1 [Hypsibius exemplaris]|uniref:Aquaporin-1 n=1 Tax=Hypsibius exemplaris TaxID=2072580 RepID=A0A1W0XCJ4_HYPEX|nr:putative Aquaporin-1 [Hypsibius exemplaris]